MAIFGAGSKWEDEEMKNEFFKNENFVIGRNIKDAEDLYSLISTIKIGDIIFLKANKPGNLDVRIKGIGIVKNSFIGVLFDNEENLPLRTENFELPVKWIVTSEFKISIPPNTGKLTHIRSGTLDEEYLPYGQKEILEKIFMQLK